jgi:hypothetical protein
MAPNPYESPPSTVDVGATVRLIAPTKAWSVFLSGVICGIACFVMATVLVPADVPSWSVHDLRLAANLSFIYPVVVGLWSAWLRRSFYWAIFGIISGIGIGTASYLFCSYHVMAAIMVFPCLLGGVALLLFGESRPSWISGAPQRFGKGLVAGLVLWFVYVLLLNAIGAFLLTPFQVPTIDDYNSMMWRAGPIAMGTASGLYFLLFRWAANQSVSGVAVDRASRTTA